MDRRLIILFVFLAIVSAIVAVLYVVIESFRERGKKREPEAAPA